MAIDPEQPLSLPRPNVRASSYYIARTRMACPHCGAITSLTALALPPGHEMVDGESNEWQSVAGSAFLYYLEAISQTVHAQLRREAPNFRFDFYWVNHCEYCERTLGDDQVHGEPGGGFTPLGEDDAASIILSYLGEPFEASAAGYSLEPEFFARMRRA